jgi:hypothetical protein
MRNAIIDLDARMLDIEGNSGVFPLEAISSSTPVSTAATSYATGVAHTGLVFTAPSSGAVYITYSAEIYSQHSSTVNTANARLAPHIKTGNIIGSGTDVYAALDDRSVIVSNSVASVTGDRYETRTQRFPWTGLTPTSQYNIQLRLKTGGSGTAFVRYGRILVEPVIYSP